jgi:glycosyltransferase involved in cell wall biosynthesis
MRITFVLPCFNLSGGIRVAAIYAEKLHRRGHKVVAVAPCEAGPTFRGIVRSLLKERRWPSAPPPEPSHFDGLAVEHRLLSHPAPVTETDVPDADVVVATWWESAEWVAKLSDAKGVKVHFMQGYETFAATPEEVDAVCRRPIPKIVISGWLRDIVRDRFGQTPLALIPNSVDTGQFNAPPRGKQATPAVGFSYSTQAIKGCDIILKAYHLAAEKVPGLRLVVISNCPISDQLPLPPGTDLAYQARDQALRGAYSRCDVWLSGTREEGFGLPILEAMACRTPVIATPAGAAPELLAKGGGVLVPHEDPGAMARAITEICSLPEDRWRALSDAALATATGYTWDDATDLFEKALREAVELARSSEHSSGNERS